MDVTGLYSTMNDKQKIFSLIGVGSLIVLFITILGSGFDGTTKVPKDRKNLHGLKAQDGTKTINESELILQNNLWFKEDSNIPFSGTVYRKTENEKKIIGKLIKGEKVGYWEEIQLLIRTEGNYKDGNKDGEWNGWYHNGQHGYKGSYLNGEKEGKWIGWYKNGQKSYEGKYINGKKEFHWIYLDDSGQKMLEGKYFNDLEDGLWTYWHENGQKESEKTFKNGELISLKCWDENGNELECK